MKKLSAFLAVVFLTAGLVAQSPQKISYQAVVRNAAGKLIQNGNIGIRLSILQGSATGTVVYTETHNAVTNINGLVSVEIGNGTPTGIFSDIDWANGPYFLKSETDPAGGVNYSVTGTNQLLSVPYALYSLKAANAFSGDYNDLTNKPVTDGSETKILAGSNISITGTGTTGTPYVIGAASNGYPTYYKTTITTTQTWTVPASVSKIKVELWGGAGGGGGAGAYSYSYNLNDGGDGGTGGYAQQEINVVANQQFLITIGNGGYAGNNAYYSYPGYYGDTDGGSGGDTWFGQFKAAGGTGGKRGGYSLVTVHGNAGMANYGTITGYADPSQSTILNVFTGLDRSYLNDRILTSKPGKGGSLDGYSAKLPTQGEAGAAVITLFE
jgi:hypothetical protein